jgi:hypothetical protein
MKCKLCDRAIKSYDPTFHQFNINDTLAVPICLECVDKFVKWQGSIYSRLFPTTAMKKRYGNASKS